MAICLFAWITYDTNKFPRKFNHTVNNNNDIASIIEVLGKPNQTIDKKDFHPHLLKDLDNKNGYRAYYWSNGIDSYHWVVADINEIVVSFGSQGW